MNSALLRGKKAADTSFYVLCLSVLSRSNQYSVVMVNLVLDDPRGDSIIGFEASFKALDLVLHLDRAVALGHARAGQGQAALVSIESAGALDELRIENHDRASVVGFIDNPRVSQ